MNDKEKPVELKFHAIRFGLIGILSAWLIALIVGSGYLILSFAKEVAQTVF